MGDWGYGYTGQNADGNIDDFMTFSKALSQDEITTLYNSGTYAILNDSTLELFYSPINIVYNPKGINILILGSGNSAIENDLSKIIEIFAGHYNVFIGYSRIFGVIHPHPIDILTIFLKYST